MQRNLSSIQRSAHCIPECVFRKPFGIFVHERLRAPGVATKGKSISRNCHCRAATQNAKSPGDETVNLIAVAEDCCRYRLASEELGRGLFLFVLQCKFNRALAEFQLLSQLAAEG